MLRLIGFLEQSGTITDERTGEVRPWSNRFIRAVTDKSDERGAYGLAAVEQKIKTVDVCRCLGIRFNDSDVSSRAFEDRVNDTLISLFDKEIEWTLGIVKGSAVVNGFRVIPDPIDK